jgi:hypothetical protein
LTFPGQFLAHLFHLGDVSMEGAGDHGCGEFRSCRTRSFNKSLLLSVQAIDLARDHLPEVTWDAI